LQSGGNNDTAIDPTRPRQAIGARTPVLLQRQQVVAATINDFLRDLGLRADRLENNQRAARFQPLQTDSLPMTGRSGHLVSTLRAI